MNLTTSILDNVAVIRVWGRFDFSMIHAFRAELKSALEHSEVGEIRVDLGGVEYMDSSALGSLLVARDESKAAGKTVSLSGATAAVKQVLDSAHFDKLFAYK